MDPQYKFKVGDVVQIVQSGYGCSPKDIGKVSIIQKCGKYSNDPGYFINPAFGNSKHINNPAYDYYKGMISEDSFRLVASYKDLKCCKR